MYEPAEVTARFDQQGKISPLRFTWQGQAYPVDSIGRQWEDESGLHYLVTSPIEQIFELRFTPEDRRWFVRRFGPKRAVV